MQLGSMFINNCNNAVNSVHLQEHLKTVVTYDARKIKHKIQRG
jgi:hypothetical protein